MPGARRECRDLPGCSVPQVCGCCACSWFGEEGSLQGNDEDETPAAPPASRLPSLTLPEAMGCFQADF